MATSLTDDRATMPPPVGVGEVILGKFRVERILGEGGMGYVVEAMHLQLDERVALKFLKREAMAMPEVIARFSQEARAAAKLKSEHVARVLDVGALPDGTPFMVMEHLTGSDLAQVLAEFGPLPIMEAVDSVVQACEALAEAHARGIVHRDIKPENLFRVRREDGWGIVKVLDFGISKVALTGRATDVNVEGKQTTAILGTPYYMSPEQLRSTRTVDHRADVWSLGAVLFELLTGATAFASQEFTALVAEILQEPHRMLRELRPDLPEGLELVVDRCLAKDRERRFANMAELAIALVPFGTKRARIAAEKAVAIVRSAGMLSDPGISVPPSMAPPPADGTPSSGAMRSRLFPHSGVVSTTGVPMSRVAMEAPTQAPPSEGGAAKLLGKPVVLVGVGAVLALAIAAGVGFAMRTPATATANAATAAPERAGAAVRSAPPSANAEAAPSGGAAASVGAAGAPSGSTTAAGAAPETSAAAAASPLAAATAVSTAAVTTARTPERAAAPAPAAAAAAPPKKAAAKPSSRPSAEDLDIRQER